MSIDYHASSVIHFVFSIAMLFGICDKMFQTFCFERLLIAL